MYVRRKIKSRQCNGMRRFYPFRQRSQAPLEFSERYIFHEKHTHAHTHTHLNADGVVLVDESRLGHPAAALVNPDQVPVLGELGRLALPVGYLLLVVLTVPSPPCRAVPVPARSVVR